MTPLPQWAHFATMILSLATLALGQLQGHGNAAGWVAVALALLVKLDAALPRLVPIIEWLRGKRSAPPAEAPPSEAETPPPVTVDAGKSK